MNTLLQDLRYAIRTLARARAFTVAAVLSLAIGIGANTTIFSVANALLLRPLPYREADRLVILWNRSPGLAITQDWFSTAQYFDIRTGHSGFEQVAIAIGGNYTLTGDGEPERIGVAQVSSNLLPMIGGRALWGRLFTPDEDAAGHAPVAVLSYDLWQRRYGGDRHIVGRPVLINGVAHPVVGILPRGFALPHEVLPILYGPPQAEILVSLPLGTGAAHNRGREDYNVIAKLRRGVTVRQAQAEMDTITARLRRDYPDYYPPNGGLTFGIVPLLDQVVGDTRRPIVILLGAVGFVLLIACANVANLLLSRAITRQKEIAVRAALGAGRGRIARQLLTESLLLAGAGGAAGVLFSWWGVRWIQAFGTKSVPRLHEIGIDSRVLLFTTVISLCAGVLFGLAPALRNSRLDLNSALKDAGRGSAGMGAMWGRGNHLRRLLVVGELALAVLLLIGAGLLIRSFARIHTVPPGFDANGVLTFDLAMAGRKYDDPQKVLSAYRELWERLDRLPGVSASGGTSSLPLTEQFAWTPIVIEGRVPPAGEKFLNADIRVVGGRYFEAMRIPLRAGRFFNEQDIIGKTRVTIIDERMAREYFPGQDPVGKRIRLVQSRLPDYWMTIVGVVGRVKQDALDSDSRIAFYRPQTQSPSRGMTVAVRAGYDPAVLGAALKRELRAIDPDLPVYAVKTMRQWVEESLAPRRFLEGLLTLFAALALALAAIGIYGVMAYLVSQGSREIGIRLALGATREAILRLVLGRGMALALYGVTIGMAAAWGLTRLMRGLLFEVDALDAATFGTTAVVLAAVAALATYAPARRASRLDPLESLRSE